MMILESILQWLIYHEEQLKTQNSKPKTPKPRPYGHTE